MKSLLRVGLVGVLVALIVWGVSAQEDACYAKNGIWSIDQQRCEMDSGIQISVDYPLEVIGTGIAEQTVDEFLQQTQSGFARSYTPDYRLPAYANAWSLNMTYELYHFSDTMLSVKFDIGTYRGGAHGDLSFQTFIFDLAQQRIVTLNDLFQEGTNPWLVIAPLVEQQLTATLSQMVGGSLSDFDLDSIRTGTGDNPDNYRSFALTHDSLIFFFPPYQVAAYAAGPQQAIIPLNQIGYLLKAEFVPPA